MSMRRSIRPSPTRAALAALLCGLALAAQAQVAECPGKPGQPSRITKADFKAVAEACRKAYPGVTRLTWGTDAGGGGNHGTPEGSCAKAAENAGGKGTPCLCYPDNSPGPTSVLEAGDWICWVSP